MNPTSRAAPLFQPLFDRPVLHWELIRLARSHWPFVLRWFYLAFLSLQFLTSAVLFPLPAPSTYVGNETPAHFPRRDLSEATAVGAAELTEKMLWQLIVALMLLTPAAAAGALGQEKERDTLVALFGTQINAWQIVTGKMFARLAAVANFALVPLPLLVITSCICGVGFGQLALALLYAFMLTFAMAAVSMLSSVWTRRTTDAILACYAAIVIILMIWVTYLSGYRLPGVVDPVGLIHELMQWQRHWQPTAILAHMAVFLTFGLACLGLAAARLRPAALSQGERRTPRHLWAFRKSIGDDPIYWREYHVLGLAPLAILRSIPRWMGLLGTFVFAAIFAGTAIESHIARSFFYALRNRNFARAWDALQHPDKAGLMMEISVLGVILIVAGPLVVGVRCVNSVAEERRRKTWDDLRMMPRSIAEIVRDKRRGVLAAALPVVVVYALPMYALAWFDPVSGLECATAWVAVSWAGMVATAHIAAISVSAKETDKDIIRQRRTPSPTHRRKSIDRSQWQFEEK